MYQSIVLVLCFLCVVWVYARWKWMKKYWEKRGIPYTPPHPIYGSLTFLQRKNPGIWMRELYEEFKTPYVGIWVFWRPGLVVNCPKIARNILVKDSDNFRNRFLSAGKKDPIGGLNLFTVNDPLWTSLRKRLNTVFTSAKLKCLHELHHRKAMELIQRIGADVEKGVTIDLRTMFSDYSTDIIGEAAFGLVGSATLTGTSPLRVVTKEFMKYSVWRGLAWSSIFFLPELVNIFGFSFFPKESVNYFRKVFKMIVKERGGYDNKTLKVRDLFDALVKMKQDGAKDNEDFSEDILVAQAVIFLQGGFDSSSLTLAYAIYELAFQPDCQEKLFKELSEAKHKLGDKEFDSVDLAELTYFNGCINEALRKYPVMGWLDRLADKDYMVDDELTIAAGTVVYVNANGMHMDPQYFPEPEAFNPDRFLPENEKNIPPYSFMPFGEGPRHCIGMRFGLNSVRYALCHIILNYEARWIPCSAKPNDIKVEKRGFFFMPEIPLAVEFVPRK